MILHLCHMAITPDLYNERLERAWVRLQRVYERQKRILDRADAMVERIQSLIDRMNENGKDTAVLQAALDTYAEALKVAHPVYESAKGILNSHLYRDKLKLCI
jgi:predicted transcriptional regulator